MPCRRCRIDGFFIPIAFSWQSSSCTLPYGQWLAPFWQPVAAFTQHFRWALMLTVVIVCECVVLAANRGRCPLTGWTARFNEDRAANFDIYLPDWLARNNKATFGTLFAVNELIVLWRWLVRP
jgi:hypothetical protein